MTAIPAVSPYLRSGGKSEQQPALGHREQQCLGAGITLPIRLPEEVVPNVVHLPQHTPTTSVWLNPSGAKGWQVLSAPV